MERRLGVSPRNGNKRQRIIGAAPLLRLVKPPFAVRLARFRSPREHLIVFAGCRRRDQRVDERRQLFLRRHGDAGFAFLKLGACSRSGPTSRCRQPNRSATWSDLLLLLDLPFFAVLLDSSLDHPEIRRAGNRAFCSSSRPRRIMTGSWIWPGTVVNVRDFRTGMFISKVN
jgi:hypothetical protein